MGLGTDRRRRRGAAHMGCDRDPPQERAGRALASAVWDARRTTALILSSIRGADMSEHLTGRRLRRLSEFIEPFRVTPGERVTLGRDFDPALKAGVEQK